MTASSNIEPLPDASGSRRLREETVCDGALRFWVGMAECVAAEGKRLGSYCIGCSRERVSTPLVVHKKTPPGKKSFGRRCRQSAAADALYVGRISVLLGSVRLRFGLFERLLLRGETSPDFLQKLDHAIFPFFETMVRQNYLVPPEYSADQLQAILRFLTSGYYGFFLQELEPDSTLRPELPQLAASISDQCLSGFFARSPAHTPLA